MAHILNQHPLCCCLHEPNLILIKIVTEYCHGQIDSDELRQYLFSPQNPYKMFPHRLGLKLYGESDQKLSYIIPILREIGDITRFIWLIRDGRSAVASMFSRGWYESEEYIKPTHLWAKYRIQGDLCGDVSPKTWQTMNSFEKCCWYWSYTNRRIADDLNKLDNNSWMMLKLEDLSDRLGDLLNFLDLPYYPLTIVRSNRSRGPTYGFDDWKEQEQDAFERWCGTEMDSWYTGWRDDKNILRSGTAASSGNKSWDTVVSIGSHAKWLGTKALRRAFTPNTSSLSADVIR